MIQAQPAFTNNSVIQAQPAVEFQFPANEIPPPQDDDGSDGSSSSYSDEAEFVYSPERTYRRSMIAAFIVSTSMLAVMFIMAYILSGAVFLYSGYLKGGHECSKTSGFKVWIYCLVNIAFVPANINSCRATYKTHHTTLRIFSLIVNFFIELMFVLYGRQVLFHPGPCEKFKKEAHHLWIWSQFAYGVKIACLITIGLSIVGLALYYFYKHVLGHANPHDLELHDIPQAEVELRSNELHVEFVENNPEPMIAGHPSFITSQNRMTHSSIDKTNIYNSLKLLVNLNDRTPCVFIDHHINEWQQVCLLWSLYHRRVEPVADILVPNRTKFIFADIFEYSFFMMLFNDNSDSDDDGVPSFLKAGSINFDDVEEVRNVVVSNIALDLEQLLLEYSVESARICSSNDGMTDLQKTCLEIIELLATGQHMTIISEKLPSSLAIANLLSEVVEEINVADSLSRRVCAYIGSGVDENVRELRALHCMLIGVTLYELYCQVNYTGPELSDTALLPLNILGGTGQAASELLHRSSIERLECDGDVPYPTCIIPQALLLARIILATIADPCRASWKHGITLDKDGIVHAKAVAHTVDPKVRQAVSRLTSRQWRSSRCAVVHLRLLQKQSFEAMPTLWKESNDMFVEAIKQFGLVSVEFEGSRSPTIDEYCASTAAYFGECAHQERSYLQAPISRRIIAAEVWIEAGLCQHYFEYKSKGKDCFKRAHSVIGIQTLLTSALGKRTKYQQFELHQLYLYAKSSIAASPALVTTVEKEATSQKKTYEFIPKQTSEPEVEEEKSSSWEHAEWELGRKLIGEVTGGEEAAVREVLLDMQDGGAAENILLEGGPKFTEDQDRGGELHPVDQALLMALCLDVKNSNPADGLTNEEMFPYVERVLQQPRNWMIHSTALLQRSWLEFEKRKTMDRAMLQMQALLDQHTTKLTITQSTFKSIEESAPSQDRLRYLSTLVYPSQYELKRDLAQRYLSCGVFNSALNYFKELEMWDEVVTCYQLLDKPQRAEWVVRDRLKFGETPYMLTALGDLTQNEELYEKAWLVSNRRYARAKRTLARMCFDKKNYVACVKHMDEALGVHPLVASAWYLKGLACMHLEDYENGLQAFSRCIQQDMEIGEAHANMGAIYMKQGLMKQAHSALKEALKQKRESWQVLENLMTVCVALEQWRELIEYMEKLLDPKLRKKSGTKFYKGELCALVRATIKGAIDVTRLKSGSSAADSNDSNPTPVLPSYAENEVSLEPPSAPADSSDLEAVMPPLFDEDDVEGADGTFFSSGVNNNGPTTSAETAELMIHRQTGLVNAVEKFLDKLSNAVDSDAEIWDIIADFYFAFDSFEKMADCRTKQFRALLQIPNWEKEIKQIDVVCQASCQLVGAHRYPCIKKTSLYSCKSLLHTASTKASSIYKMEGLEAPASVQEIAAYLAEAEAMYAARVDG